MVRRLTILVLSSLLWTGCGAAGDPSLTAHAAPPNQYDQAQIRHQLTELYEAAGTKAMLATVRQGDQDLVTLALGESMAGVPASIDDHFRIGGVSELFWGTLVMRLVELGHVSLDDKVSKWLPDLVHADQVTLGMLLNNTAGYKDYVLDPEFIDDVMAEPFRTFTRQELIAYSVKDGQLNFPAGTQAKYSHIEFSIMGLALEKATGKSMADLYREHILTPAGLSHTGPMVNSALPYPVLHAYTSDRGVYEDCTFWNPSWPGDSGPLYSTLGDLAKWSRIHGQGQLLQPDSFARLKARPEVASDGPTYFAGGFIVSNGWFCQNPSFNGYSGAYAYLPDEDLTVIVYTTQSQDPASDGQAIKILKQVVASLTPGRPLAF